MPTRSRDSGYAHIGHCLHGTTPSLPLRECEVILAPALRFPLLNKGEFFVVKLLLSGRLATRDLSLRILADDLPRSVRVKDLPPAALEQKAYKVEWEAAAAGAVVLVFPLWASYCLYLLYKSRPELFPYPWTTFKASFEALSLVLPGGVILGFLFLVGLLLLLTAAFGGELPPRRGPHFPLPKELRHAVFPHGVFRLSAPGLMDDEPATPRLPPGETRRSNEALQRTGDGRMDARR